MKTINCPACGTSNEVKNPGIIMTTCKNCHSILYWDEFQFVQNGPKINPDEPEPYWSIGSTGTINNVSFEVLGWMRFSYSRGYYDECFVRYGDDYAILMSDTKCPLLENSDDYIRLCPIAQNCEELMGWQHPALGNSITLGEENLAILAADRTKCIAVKGELPFAILPGEYLNYYIALSPDGQRVAQIYCNSRGKFSLLLYNNELLEFNKEEESESSAEELDTPTEYTCAACHTALPKPPDEAVMMTCPSCGVLNDIAHEEIQVLGKSHASSGEAHFDYNLNQTFKFNDVIYHVVACQFHCINAKHSQLYILTDKDCEEFFYLEKSELGTFILAAAEHLPAGNIQQWNRLQPGDNIDINEETYQVAEVNRTTINALKGTFPYAAAVGDDLLVTIALNNGEVYKIERTRTDILFYSGRILSPAEESQALGRRVRSSFIPHQHNESSGDKPNSAPIPAGSAGSSPKKGGCAKGCGCLFLLFVLLFGMGVLALLEDEDFREELVSIFNSDSSVKGKAKTVLATRAENERNFTENYQNPWQQIVDSKYLTLDEQKEYIKLIKIGELAFSGTEARANELKHLLDDSGHHERIKELTEVLEHENYTYMAVSKKIAATLDPLFEERDNVIKEIEAFNNGYEQLRNWLKQDPTKDWEDSVADATQYWPKTAQTLNKLKTGRDQKKKAMLTAFKAMVDMNLTAENITRAQKEKFDAKMKVYEQKRDDFNESNQNLKETIDSLYDKVEVILIDLYKNSRGAADAQILTEKPYIAEFKTITYTIESDRPAYKVRNEQQKIDEEEFKKLSPYLGMAVKYKFQGDFTDNMRTFPLTAGYTLVPSPGKSNKAAKWEGDKLIFDENISNLPNELWNGCLQPPADTLHVDDADEMSGMVGKIIGSAGSWTKECYKTARFYQNN